MQNGEKYGAHWRADGARQTTRMAGRKKDVGTHNPPANQATMRSQDTQAERITFGVELETTIPAMSGIAVGGYHSGAADGNA